MSVIEQHPVRAGWVSVPEEQAGPAAQGPGTGSGPIANRNPLAKFAAASLIMIGLLPSGDPVAPAIVLAATIATLPFLGLPVRALTRRLVPLSVAVALVGVANTIVVRDLPGAVLVDLGPLTITRAAFAAAGASMLRLLAIALPGVLAAMTTEPLDLADALVQQARAPARFVYGAVAALRLVPLVSEEWETLRRARRARGVAGGLNPLAQARLGTASLVTLLVGAIRRATRLATAMDARGFGTRANRTFARPQSFSRGDLLLVGATAILCAAAIALSVRTGAWRPVLG